MLCVLCNLPCCVLCFVLLCHVVCVEKWWYCRWLWWLLARPPGSPISHGASQLTILIGTTAAACVNIMLILVISPLELGQARTACSMKLLGTGGRHTFICFHHQVKLRVKMRACVNMCYCRHCRVITASSILLNTQEPGDCRIWNFYLLGQCSTLLISQYVKNQYIILFDPHQL